MYGGIHVHTAPRKHKVQQSNGGTQLEAGNVGGGGEASQGQVLASYSALQGACCASNAREQATARCKLHSNADVLARYEDLTELNNVRVAQHAMVEDLCLNISVESGGEGSRQQDQQVCHEAGFGAEARPKTRSGEVVMVVVGGGEGGGGDMQQSYNHSCLPVSCHPVSEEDA